MFKNYLKIAYRNLKQRRSYAAINIAGLAVGMACCLLILLFVRDELSYDRFHEQSDRIYRIASQWEGFSLPATNWPFVERLRSDYPELEMTHFLRTDGLVQRGERAFREDQVLFAPPDFFDVFSFELLRGSPEAALGAPYTAVLTPETAEKYFGPDTDPVGETLRLDTNIEVEVTGLVAAAPRNSHFSYDLLVSWSTLDAAFNYTDQVSWGNNSIYTYLALPPGRTPASLEAQFPDLIERHAGEDWNGAELELQALTDIHLYSRHQMELQANSDIAYVYVFSAIAAFILFLACINFMNLSTAQSTERAREVGVRKSMGAERRQLVGQFLAESVLLALGALLVAVVLVGLALPAFRALSGKALTLAVLADGFTIGTFVGVALLTGLLAGSYPAFVLSGFAPVQVLRGRSRTGGQGVLLRKGLVVFQFAVSVVLLVGTAVVYNQLHFMRTAELGFQQEQVLVVPAQQQGPAVGAQYAALKEAFLAQPAVEEVAAASQELPADLLDGYGARFQEAPPDSAAGIRAISVGHDFFETLGVEMAAGRGFREALATDSSAYVMNETAARLLAGHLPEPPQELAALIGQTVQVYGDPPDGPLVGIVRDFNMKALHEPIEPMIFHIRPAWFSTYLLRVQAEQPDRVLASVREVWEQFFPEYPFEYHFADRGFEAQYHAQERLSRVFGIFTALALFVACLGLFGLTAYATAQRKKEIGVRKVLGASAMSIFSLLSKDFLRLVLVAIALAVPVAYFVMQSWLGQFPYRLTISPWLFVGAGLVTLLIALVTVSYQGLKAAYSDPVDSLRYE